MFKSLKFKIISISLLGVFALLVTLFTYIIPLYRDSVREGLQHEVKAAVDLAGSTIEHYAKLADDKVISVEEAQRLAKDTIRSMRYNENDYFFIYDFNSITIAHGTNPALEGQDRSSALDPNGVAYQKNMLALATSPGGSGFTEYTFPKGKDGPPVKKSAYVRSYKPWKWYVGSGVYQDVVDSQTQVFEVRMVTVFVVVSALVLVLALGFSFNLSKRINTIVSSLSKSSEEVGHSIIAVSEAGKSLAESSTSAAASLEETVASLEEVTSVVNLNSGNAQQASTLSQSSRSTAETGEQQMKVLVDSMNEIATYSHKIEEIINVIDDIAFQTNLLALNAAVEAARAGEQGKGFAVVADAVRTLAQRSASAAKDISGLIKESVEKVDDGQRLADKSGEVLVHILSSVKKVADLNGEIATASGEQTTGIHQISQAMNQLDSVIQSNAAATEEISANVVDIGSRMKNVENDVELLKKLVHG
ncbi:methyl-accepting chemotaxis protein [Bdellovibrio sp. HCB185ZH]|uniref:methyl-accepting chemotaxis protein n=1 Tax=Bdellovibrio sp. HCB185ZH TaxID=3394235 RepID=UPI0039A507AA